MVSYNPIKQNPSVMAETMMQLIPFFMQNPNVDVRRFTEEVVQGMGLPNKILMPEPDVVAKVAAESQLAAQAALGGAAAPAGGGAEGEIPPELLAALMAEGGAPAPEEALAAGGGAPIREGTPPAEAK